MSKVRLLTQRQSYELLLNLGLILFLLLRYFLYVNGIIILNNIFIINRLIKNIEAVLKVFLNADDADNTDFHGFYIVDN